MESSRRNEPAYAQADDRTLVSRARAVSADSLLGFLRGGNAPRLAWTDPGGLAVAGRGTAATLAADGSDRFDVVRERAADLFADHDDAGVHRAARPRLLGGFAFDTFDGTSEQGAPWLGFPDAQFVLPAVQLADANGETWLTASAYGPDVDPGVLEERLDRAERELAGSGTYELPGVADTRSTSHEEWNEGVAAAVERIRAGELEKVVLAQALTAALDGPLSVPDLLDHLRIDYPNCYRFLVEPSDGATFFGVTPERLVSLSGRRVETEALAGSVARGDTPEADDALADRLADSTKVAEEHGLVAETIRKQLASLDADVTVGERGVARLDNVQHLRTPIRADLGADAHVLSVVAALHPTPAVGGIPLDAALRTIRETERFDRGWYAAPVGWFDADGDGTFSVGIRSGVSTGNAVTLFAGNGIVADSDPDEEWDEVRLKYRPILDALEGE